MRRKAFKKIDKKFSQTVLKEFIIMDAESKCERCNNVWKHEGSFPVTDRKNICDQCTIDIAKEEDKGVPGSENIDKDRDYYVKGDCCCYDKTLTKEVPCFSCKTQVEIPQDDYDKRSKCSAVTVINDNGRVRSFVHKEVPIAICSGPVPTLCKECDEQYELVGCGWGMASNWDLKEKV